MFKGIDKYRDEGLLILRIGIGIAFMVHGYPKMAGGMETWVRLGGAMSGLGIEFWPGFWGFMAALSEFGGGLLLALGLFTRPVVVLMFITMLVATHMHIARDDSFGRYSNALKSAILFISLFFIGPGKYSLDEIWFNRSAKPNNSEAN